MKSGNPKILLWLTLFSLAFGYIEAAVVVYLRELYYPGGFHFPLVDLPVQIIWTEMARELATILLLFSVAMLAVKEGLRRFAVFAYCFGVWDLVYYLVLKITLDWPSSFLEWDILFLIPVPWTGPVLAPMLVATSLVFGAVLILRLSEEHLMQTDKNDWTIGIFAAVVIFASFIWNSPVIAADEILISYPWWLFATGYLVGAGWFTWRYLSMMHLVRGPGLINDRVK
ncbi:MAG: hypothetical protein KAU50_01725 [Candidatus Marinimicrobia bacterium]|nr:hypothetical protein [Candidatus Neomarinimicrobiota bacterium]